MKNNSTIIILVIVVALIGFGAYFLLIINDSPGTSKEDEMIEENESAKEQSEVAPEEDEEIERIDLIGVGSNDGEGSAKRSYDGDKFTFSAQAELKEAPPGKFYEGWLVDKDGSFFSTGRMSKEGDSFDLKYSASKDRSSYGKVVITEETEADGLDNLPETHILEGSF